MRGRTTMAQSVAPSGVGIRMSRRMSKAVVSYAAPVLCARADDDNMVRTVTSSSLRMACLRLARPADRRMLSRPPAGQDSGDDPDLVGDQAEILIPMPSSGTVPACASREAAWRCGRRGNDRALGLATTRTCLRRLLTEQEDLESRCATPRQVVRTRWSARQRVPAGRGLPPRP